jgi:hypothetical protein
MTIMNSPSAPQKLKLLNKLCRAIHSCHSRLEPADVRSPADSAPFRGTERGRSLCHPGDALRSHGRAHRSRLHIYAVPEVFYRSV